MKLRLQGWSNHSHIIVTCLRTSEDKFCQGSHHHNYVFHLSISFLSFRRYVTSQPQEMCGIVWMIPSLILFLPQCFSSVDVLWLILLHYVLKMVTFVIATSFFKVLPKNLPFAFSVIEKNLYRNLSLIFSTQHQMIRYLETCGVYKYWLLFYYFRSNISLWKVFPFNGIGVEIWNQVLAAWVMGFHAVVTWANQQCNLSTKDPITQVSNNICEN